MAIERRDAGLVLAALCFGGLVMASLTSEELEPAGRFRDRAPETFRPVREAESRTKGWPETPRLAAARLLKRYGTPDSASEDRLMWMNRGDWLRIAVCREENPARPYGVIEQDLRYQAPASRWSDLNKLGIGVTYEPIGRTLSAASESEETGVLALNVAVDVIEGRRSVDEGRRFYRKTFDLALSGKSSAYTRTLRFKPSGRSKNRLPPQLWPML